MKNQESRLSTYLEHAFTTCGLSEMNLKIYKQRITFLRSMYN